MSVAFLSPRPPEVRVPAAPPNINTKPPDEGFPACCRKLRNGPGIWISCKFFPVKACEVLRPGFHFSLARARERAARGNISEPFINLLLEKFVTENQGS